MSEHRVIIQISDTHVVPEGILKDGVDSYAELAAVFAQLEASETRPDALVLSGDLADTGSPDAYRRVRGLVEPAAARLGVPVCYLPGNHDEREAFREVLLDGEGEASLDQVLWVGGLRIVALDSTIPGHHHGRLDPQQLEFLAHVLAEPAPEGTLVAIHHPPLPSPVHIAQLLSLRNPQDLASVIAGRDVLMVIAGHTHHAAAGLLGGVPVWVSSASVYQADVLAPDNLERSIPGVTFSRIDIVDHTATATQISIVIDTEPIEETDVSGAEEWLRRTGAL
jgi:Icc protein